TFPPRHARADSATRATIAHVMAITSKRRNTTVMASALVGAGTIPKTVGATTAPRMTRPPSHSAKTSTHTTATAGTNNGRSGRGAGVNGPVTDECILQVHSDAVLAFQGANLERGRS